jgi:ribonucleotide monophosphatase NagD (HAD superfamily)
MRTLVVIQIHPDGQKNIAFSTDPIISAGDLLVTAGEWKNAQTIMGHVFVIGDDNIVDHLTNCEFRSVDNVAKIETHTLADEQALPIEAFITAHFKRELAADPLKED